MVLAGALVAAAALRPQPWRLQVGAPGDAYFLSNAYPPERGETPLRWARATTALHLHGAYPGAAAVELRLFRDPAATAGRAWPLELRPTNGEPARFMAAPGWRRYQLALPPGAAAAPLTLVGPTFQPGPGDPRNLSVAMSELRVAPLTGAPPLGAAAGRGGWLAGLLALAAGAIALIDAWSLGAAGAPGRPWRAFVLVVGLGAAAVAWAWLGPASFAWALPANWLLLALGALLLAAAAALHLGGSQAWGRSGAPTTARVIALGAVAALGLAHAALLPGLPSLWQQTGALLILLGPGALAALALLWDEADSAERAFAAVAGGLGVAALLMLALHALPGAPPWWLPLLAADTLSAAGLAALLARRGPLAPPQRARPQRWLALPLLLGGALRLWGLGTSQFQGDEAYAMLLANGVARGLDEVLLVHLKGPVEALLPAGPLAITGTIAEASARLPFALAGVGLILAAWALAGRLIGGRAGDVAGFAAALAVAADGLLLAFGRIVQYQMMVALMSAAALWLCWRFYEGAAARRTLPAAALCAAVAVLAHYDGIYVAPAMGWLVLAGGWRRRWRPAAWLAGVGSAVAVGLILSLSFYLPFVRHEHFASTVYHLETRSGQAGGVIFYNNLPGYAALLSVYATRYVATFAALALLGALAALLAAYLRPRPLGAVLALWLAAGGPVALLTARALSLGPDASLAIWLVAPPLAALCLAPRLPAGLRALALWLAAALTAHAFLIADPRTHFYTAHLAGWLLVGWGVARLWALAEGRGSGALRPTIAVAGGAALTLGLAYTGMVVLRPWPEYERAYPATLLPFYTPPGGETLPDDGLFGFPARDGWKAAAQLFATGELRGAIDTNQKIFTAGWYMRGQFRCQRDPDYFLTATGATPLYIPPGYSLAVAVTVDGVEALRIYSRAPVAGPPRVVDAAAAAAYDAAPVPSFPLRRLLTGVVPQTTLEAAWRDGFALRGFDLDRAELGPGEISFLTLYWRASAYLPPTLEPAVQVRDGAGRVVGEAEPFCNPVSPDDWRRTYVSDTPFRLAADGLAPGVYTLHAGVRDRASGAWATLQDGGELLELTTIRVR